MRFRIPKYFPGWFVSGGGGSGGAATVQTDGVTIQGDGSAGNKIAIKAVQTDATLTGAGTVASPLSAVQQTPTGWPLSSWSIGGSAASARFLAPSANTIRAIGFFLGVQIRVSNISIDIGTADAGGLYDVGIYNLAGTRQTHIGAQALPSTGLQTFALTGAPVTLNPGLYFWATTWNAATATTFEQQNAATCWSFAQATNAGSSTAGALPGTFTPPANAPAFFAPLFLLT